MAGNIGTTSCSLAVSRCDSDSLLHDPTVENIPATTEVAVMSTTITSTEPLPIRADGPCSMVLAGDGGLLPPSCVVEDDELLTSHGRRHRHRRHRSSSRHHHRFCRVRWKEVDYMAALLNIIAAVLVCTSLAEPRWWYIGGSPCLDHSQHASYLGVKQFLNKGFFVDRGTSGVQENSKYYYGTLPTEVLENCIVPRTVYVIKAIIALCFVVIALCLMAVLFDVVIFSNRCMKAVRRHAILTILAVCMCVTINGLSYLVTQQLAEFYHSQLSSDVAAHVEFSFSFYIIMAAGIVCVFSVAFSLLCRCRCHAGCGCCPDSGHDHAAGRRRRDERLIDADFNQMCASAGTATPISALPPPYTP